MKITNKKNWFKKIAKNYIFTLYLVDFSFLLLDDNKEIVKKFQIVGKTTIEIEENIEKIQLDN